MADNDSGGLPFPISTAVNILNPLPDIKYQLTGVVGLYTFGRMYKGYGAGIFPSVFTAMLPGQYGFLGKSKAAGYARSWLKGIHYGGADKMMEALKVGSDFKAPFMKALMGVLKKSSVSTYDADAFVASLAGAMKKVGISTTGVKGAAATVGGLGHGAVIGHAIGSVALPIIGGIVAGEVLSSMVGATYKMGVAAINVMDRISENIRNLETGGQLGLGYISSAGKTERQRSIAGIQRSHINGRRFMGNEAAQYAEII